jgi:hypothetical protein
MRPFTGEREEKGEQREFEWKGKNRGVQVRVPESTNECQRQQQRQQLQQRQQQ